MLHHQGTVYLQVIGVILARHECIGTPHERSCMRQELQTMLSCATGCEGHLGLYQGAQPARSQEQTQDSLRREAGQDPWTQNGHVQDEQGFVQACVHPRSAACFRSVVPCKAWKDALKVSRCEASKLLMAEHGAAYHARIGWDWKSLSFVSLLASLQP